MSTIPPNWQKNIDSIAGGLKLKIHHASIPTASPNPQSYRVLFNGSPATAKIFAAHLSTIANKQIHTVDLSGLISKYIGETEKSLDQLFTDAKQKGWILFFDEADAIFGKRTDIKDAHDKYANQVVAYLLQRIESYDGPIILATNDKEPIDPRFLSRFNTILHHPDNP